MNARLCRSAVACRAVKQQIVSYRFCFPSPRKQVANHRLSTALRSKQADDEAGTVQAPVVNALTAIGLFGTVAVTGASLCGIKVFNLFQWNADDILLALRINFVLLVVDALLFVPSYGIPAPLLTESSEDLSKSKAIIEIFPINSSNGSSSSDSGSVQQQQQQHLVDMSAVKSATMWSANSWLLMLALYRSVLRRPTTDQLPKQVSAGLKVARETSKELLQRGFLLTALAGWLTDRLYEAGLDETVSLTPGGLQLPLPQLGFWVGSLLATLVFSPAAFIAAQEGAESVSGALLVRTEVGQQALLAAAAEGSSNTTLQQQQQQQPRDAAADVGPIQRQESQEDSDRKDDEVVLDPDVLEYRLFRATEECVNSAAVKAAYGLTAAKELARIALANVSFVATNGNLAATWSCSLLLNCLLLVYGALPGQHSSSSSSSRALQQTKLDR